MQCCAKKESNYPLFLVGVTNQIIDTLVLQTVVHHHSECHKSEISKSKSQRSVRKNWKMEGSEVVSAKCGSWSPHEERD